jgi:hypothetical protein
LATTVYLFTVSTLTRKPPNCLGIGNAASVFKIFWFHLHFQSDFKNLASENRDSSRIAAPILLVQIELGMREYALSTTLGSVLGRKQPFYEAFHRVTSPVPIMALPCALLGISHTPQPGLS